MKYYRNIVAIVGLIGISPIIWAIIDFISTSFFHFYVSNPFGGCAPTGVHTRCIDNMINTFIFGIGIAFLLSLFGKMIEPKKS